ncbi:efflux transporter outer membrane subunit [uncultured Rikenella sp.]|uniref:efflux transporter outer membrane subunit n=1 Tax=uncultured Rikenella sp. TaxID=368003 RepID=UPI002630DC81|nr:efflux transporter outer membrane subunit [uncultured Rikenella sp.]
MKKVRSKRNWPVVLAVTLGLAGCAVGPKFRSPEVTVPSAYIYDSVGTRGDTVVNLAWWRSFGDPTLTDLIEQALDSNRNLAVAASRIEQARLQLKMARTGFGPEFDLGRNTGASYEGANGEVIQKYEIQATVAWEIDLFGKLRHTAESAQAQMLATEQNYRSLMLSLAAEVATTYFNLLQYDMSLRIAQETYELRKASQDIIDSLVYYGMSSSVDLEQARSLTATAAAAIPQYERAKVQAETALCALLGRNPRFFDVDGTRLFTSVLVPAEVPVGLPASLLDRRPDIREAYYRVAAATAHVGVAVANRYPSVTLTGDGGLFSSTLKGLVHGNPFGWSAALSIAQPLFAWGKNKRAEEIAREENKQAILNYEQTVIAALGEVESALAGIATYHTQVNRYRELLQATRTTQMLTQELYRNGSNTYLDVLDAERELFSTQIGFSEVLAAQLAEYVSLYKALGGGW